MGLKTINEKCNERNKECHERNTKSAMKKQEMQKTETSDKI